MVALDKPLEVVRAHLFFAFNHELHIAGHVALGNHGLKSLDVHKELTLVVAGAASKNGSVGVNGGGANFGLKGWSRPQIQGICRLHVVVAVDQNGWARGIDEVLAVDYRISRCGTDFDVLCSGFGQKVGDGIGRGKHRIFVSRICRNTW